MNFRTQVVIIGAGPAGLMLSHLLYRAGIESILLERRSRDDVERVVRAGVLEQGTVDLLNTTGVGARMQREGFVHRGVYLRFAGETHRIDFKSLTGGKCVTVYAQHEVIKDLIQTRLEVEGDLRFAVEGVALHDIDSTRPSVTYRDASGTHTIDCELIAGCDGSQGTCKGHVPEHVLTTYERVYPFGWFGIMVEAPPSSDELIYASHERGFALVSTRSSTLQRMYFQCDPSDRVENWPDARIWQELRTLLATRDGWTPHEGPITQKVIVGMRSAVTEPMQYGRLYLAGDAAHIVPPTGAKGLNLAIADVRVLADAMIEFFTSGETESLARYSATALDRVWKATRFSWWMTSLMHRFPDKDAFQRRVQLAELAYVSESRVAAAALAENYVGLPFAPRSHALSMDHTPRNIEIA